MLKYDSEEEFYVRRGYINRTKIYLYPAVILLKSYKPFLSNLKDNLLCVSYKNEKIVVYYDRKNTIGIHELITALKENGEYIDDYMHNENVYTVEIRPDLNYTAFEEGRYTGIYTIDQINQCFTKDSKTRKVLVKDPEYKQTYVDLLNEWFNTAHTIKSIESRDNGLYVEISQFDIPPQFNQETLGYEKSNRIGSAGIIKKSGTDAFKI